MSLCNEETSLESMFLFSYARNSYELSKFLSIRYVATDFKINNFACKYQIRCRVVFLFKYKENFKQRCHRRHDVFRRWLGKFIYYFIKTVCKLSACLRGPKDASRRRQITAKNTSVRFLIGSLVRRLGVCSSFVGTGRNANNAYYHSLCFPSVLSSSSVFISSRLSVT